MARFVSTTLFCQQNLMQTIPLFFTSDKSISNLLNLFFWQYQSFEYWCSLCISLWFSLLDFTGAHCLVPVKCSYCGNVTQHRTSLLCNTPASAVRQCVSTTIFLFFPANLNSLYCNQLVGAESRR